MLDKSSLDKSMIEPMKLDVTEGETSSTSNGIREEKLQTREGKSGTRTVKQTLAIDILKARKAHEHLAK